MSGICAYSGIGNLTNQSVTVSAGGGSGADARQPVAAGETGSWAHDGLS